MHFVYNNNKYDNNKDILGEIFENGKEWIILLRLIAKCFKLSLFYHRMLIKKSRTNAFITYDVIKVKYVLIRFRWQDKGGQNNRFLLSLNGPINKSELEDKRRSARA